MVGLVCVGRCRDARVLCAVVAIVGVKGRSGVLRLLTVLGLLTVRRRRAVPSVPSIGLLLRIVVHRVGLVVRMVAILRRRRHPSGAVDGLTAATATTASG